MPSMHKYTIQVNKNTKICIYPMHFINLQVNTSYCRTFKSIHMNKNIITILQSKDAGRIYNAKNILENANICSFVKNEFRPYEIGYIELQIFYKDKEAALELLRKYFPNEFQQKITCPYCGSENIRIMTDARFKLIKVLKMMIKRMEYLLLQQLPEGTYFCKSCHKKFFHKK